MPRGAAFGAVSVILLLVLKLEVVKSNFPGLAAVAPPVIGNQTAVRGLLSFFHLKPSHAKRTG